MAQYNLIVVATDTVADSQSTLQVGTCSPSTSIAIRNSAVSRGVGLRLIYCILYESFLLQTEAVVTITVLDVNDNTPQFVSSSYEGRVDENRQPGTTVTLVPTDKKG